MESPNEMQHETLEPPVSSTSRLGVASLALSILGIIGYCIPFGIGFAVGMTGNIDMLTSNPGLTSTLNVIGYCGNFLGLIAIVLGGISIAREEKKGLGIAGLVLSLLLTCGCLAGMAYNLSQL